MTFIANMRTDMRVCECVCILPIYTSHAVTVLTTFVLFCHDVCKDGHVSKLEWV